jgi:hypothetical protein
VVVALYMIATLVYYPINFDAFITHMPLMRFGVVALAWYKYVFFASVLKRP